MNHNPPALGHLSIWQLRDYLETARSCAARGCRLCRWDAAFYALELARRQERDRSRRELLEHAQRSAGA